MKEFKIKDICEVVSGGTPSTKINSYWNGDIIWLTPKDLSSNKNKWIYNSEETITEEGLTHSSAQMLPINAVLLSSRAPIGYLALAGKELCTNQGFKSMICNTDHVLPEYLYYLLQTKVEELNNISTGSTFKELSGSLLKNFKISIHDLDFQQHIVDILGSIDDKIELNSNIIAKIQDLIRLEYEKSFPYIHDLKGENVTTLNDVCERFATGLNPRSNFTLGQGNNFYVTIKNFVTGNIFLDDKCDKIDDEALIKINKRSDLKKGDILFSGIGTIGRTYLIIEEPVNWNISESVFTIRPGKSISSEFLYLLLSDYDMQSYAINNASGSVQKGIRMADLKAYKFNLPEPEIIKKFTKNVSPMFIEMELLKKQISNLKTLKQLYLKKFFD